MKKVISLALVFAMCLALCACAGSNACNCDCPQCAQCDEKNHNTDSTSTTAAQNDNVIEFETPVVVAEDEYLRVELVRFYQDYRTFSVQGYPSSADATTEGATLEKYVVFRFHNKTDHSLSISLGDIYLGSDGAFCVYDYLSEKIAPGKNIIIDFIIQAGDKKTVNSMEDLYSLDGDFKIWHIDSDGVLKNAYQLDFSIPNAMNKENNSTLSNSDSTHAWAQFLDYLKEKGPVTVVTDKTNSGQNQVTIEAKDDRIRVFFLGESSTVSGKASAHGRNSSEFYLAANAASVSVHINFRIEGKDEYDVTHLQLAETDYTWDIQNYRSGDEISFPVKLTLVDGNTTTEKSASLVGSDSFVDITDALSQTLTASGLNVTMADLGFTSY